MTTITEVKERVSGFENSDKTLTVWFQTDDYADVELAKALIETFVNLIDEQIINKPRDIDG